uniref:PiggyBac transposable element-derived protein domain-containing protein n=1 Tax=Homalodisca liturata TaxID=320908 RepID=A0A1B6K758_9HEMI
MQNSNNCYSMGEYCCIDEMLVAFRGSCSFRMYMPNIYILTLGCVWMDVYGSNASLMLEHIISQIITSILEKTVMAEASQKSNKKHFSNQSSRRVVRFVKSIENTKHNC